MVQTNDSQIFGAFLEVIPASEEYLTLNFSPSSAPRKRRWSNYGLSADFLGDYFAAFFPGDALPNSQINRRNTVKASVSYIANELIENAVKYSDEAFSLPISITLFLYELEIIFQITNYSTLDVGEDYQTFVQAILNSEPGEFYMQQLEKTATGSGGSSMGLLTMINDYSAQFGWRFQTSHHHPDAVQVTVMAHLKV